MDFDKSLTEWEAKFNQWKTDNKDHPDKIAYLKYEKQWNEIRENIYAQRDAFRRRLEAAAKVEPPLAATPEAKEVNSKVQVTCDGSVVHDVPADVLPRETPPPDPASSPAAMLGGSFTSFGIRPRGLPAASSVPPARSVGPLFGRPRLPPRAVVVPPTELRGLVANSSEVEHLLAHPYSVPSESSCAPDLKSSTNFQDAQPLKPEPPGWKASAPLSLRVDNEPLTTSPTVLIIDGGVVTRRGRHHAAVRIRQPIQSFEVESSLFIRKATRAFLLSKLPKVSPAVLEEDAEIEDVTMEDQSPTPPIAARAVQHQFDATSNVRAKQEKHIAEKSITVMVPEALEPKSDIPMPLGVKGEGKKGVEGMIQVQVNLDVVETEAGEEKVQETVATNGIPVDGSTSHEKVSVDESKTECKRVLEDVNPEGGCIINSVTSNDDRVDLDGSILEQKTTLEKKEALLEVTSEKSLNLTDDESAKKMDVDGGTATCLSNPQTAEGEKQVEARSDKSTEDLKSNRTQSVVCCSETPKSFSSHPELSNVTSFLQKPSETKIEFSPRPETSRPSDEGNMFRRRTLQAASTVSSTARGTVWDPSPESPPVKKWRRRNYIPPPPKRTFGPRKPIKVVDYGHRPIDYGGTTVPPKETDHVLLTSLPDLSLKPKNTLFSAVKLSGESGLPTFDLGFLTKAAEGLKKLREGMIQIGNPNAAVAPLFAAASSSDTGWERYVPPPPPHPPPQPPPPPPSPSLPVVPSGWERFVPIRSQPPPQPVPPSDYSYPRPESPPSSRSGTRYAEEPESLRSGDRGWSRHEEERRLYHLTEELSPEERRHEVRQANRYDDERRYADYRRYRDEEERSSRRNDDERRSYGQHDERRPNRDDDRNRYRGDDNDGDIHRVRAGESPHHHADGGERRLRHAADERRRGPVEEIEKQENGERPEMRNPEQDLELDMSDGGESLMDYSIGDEVQKKIVQVDSMLGGDKSKRSKKLLVVLRGLPGSGKSHVAKLIKEKEKEQGGNAPRILCLDDYFMTDIDVTSRDVVSGRSVTKKALEYLYEADMEESYRSSLAKSFRKQIDDGYFSFIILDCIHDKIKHFEELASYASSKGFKVFIVEMEVDLDTCITRNIHRRSADEIQALHKGWEATPLTYSFLDVQSLLQADVVEVERESNSSSDAEATEEYSEHPRSRWEIPDMSEEKKCALDGLIHVKKRFADHVNSLDDVLQVLDDYESRTSRPGQKRVRWADIEEQKTQRRMRDIGFIVGQTDWHRMTDPTFGGSALTRTKYI